MMRSVRTKLTSRSARPLRWIHGGLIALALAVSAGTAGSAYAQQGRIEDTEMDGRLIGYEANVGNEKDSTTPLWFIYFFLVVVGCSALFKTAKRE